MNSFFTIYSFLIFLNLFFIYSSYKNYSLECTTNLKIKQLPNNEYFVLLYNAMYIYNNNFACIARIHKFGAEYNFFDINKITISELKDDNNTYIFILIKNDLFLFNYNKRNVTCFNLNIDLNDKNYNLIPFKTKNNTLDYIIYYPYSDASLKIFHYQNEFSSDDIYISNILKSMSCCNLNNDLDNFENKCLNCHLINETCLTCIYRKNRDNKKYIVFPCFNLTKNLSKVIEDYNYTLDNDNIEIKSLLNIYNNTILCCYKVQIEKKIYCLYYNFINGNHTIERSKYNISDCNNFEIFYLKENNDYILICNKDNNKEGMNKNQYLYYYIINENNVNGLTYNYINTDCDNIKNFTLVFNNNSNSKYSLISYCSKSNNNACYLIYNNLNFSLNDNNSNSNNTNNNNNNEKNISNEIFTGGKEELLQNLNNIVKNITL